MHAKFLPFCWGITCGQVTLAWMWRWVQMLASIERTIACMSRSEVGAELGGAGLDGVELVGDPDEPQALIGAVTASIATAASHLRRAQAPGADIASSDGMCIGGG